MQISRELNLQQFDFWSSAKNHSFTYTELRGLEIALEDLYPDGCTETQINDLFWFEEELLCDFLGLNYEEYLERE